MKLSELKDSEAAMCKLPAQYEACNNNGRILGFCGFKKEDIDALAERLLRKGYVLRRDVVIY